MADRTKKLLITVLLMILLVIVGTRVGAVVELQEAISQVKGELKYNGTMMKRSDFLRLYVAPKQLNWFDRVLFDFRPSTLWAILYTIGGLAGGIAATWLAMAGFQRSARRPTTLVPGLLSSTVAGALFYFVIKLPAPLLTKLLPSMPEIEGGSSHILGSLLALPVLAGLFTATFFERIEEWFGNLFKGKGQQQ